MKLFLRKAHRIYYLGMAFLCFLLCLPILLILVRKPERYYQQLVFFRKWISVLSAAAAGIRFKFHYEVSIDWSRPYVLCPNHTSTLDISVLTHLCPQPFSFMGKVELLRNPVTALFFRSIDIPVDRDNRMSSFRAFKRGSELLQQGRSLVVFPEGKIGDEYPPQLHPFKSGPFRLAHENRIMILPIVIHNAWNLMWDDGGQYGTRPGTVHISVLRPIAVNELSVADPASLAEITYDCMNEAWLNSKINELKNR
ncbi:1-acyl-sn-glycerol-3-phosphate acyltransferase [Sphingobacterium sp. lm-10]|uniref:lysophospholipid acyltransferase family protein n=1 Tax=Sphingobacterium sp. lm-10 TaxID=2944904 RepID=UPI002021B428|nr:lysophospholipid acyltransferase family protein [Sphingobacterium sp. lm-10]MCL7988909.1 1-acyl-sn-glycerol-3-phosphate acyltransferase [Sphingobacterium sp. lm-10]